MHRTNPFIVQILQNPNSVKNFLADVMETELSGIRHIYQKNALLDVFGETGPLSDIMVEDEERNCYVIQYLEDVDVDLNQLRRHYQCMVDDYYFYQVRCGMNFPEIYIIFLCNYDYFGYGLARYYTGDILDDGTEIEDGRHMIVLNSQYRDANVSHQIKEMLDRIRYSEKKLG